MKQVKEALEEEIKILRQFNAELDSKFPDLLKKKRKGKGLNLKRILKRISCFVIDNALIMIFYLALGADLILGNGWEIILDCILIFAYNFLINRSNK